MFITQLTFFCLFFETQGFLCVAVADLDLKLRDLPASVSGIKDALHHCLATHLISNPFLIVVFSETFYHGRIFKTLAFS